MPSNATDNPIRQLGWASSLAVCLLLCFVIYRPGLSGDFMLDDIPNLSPLAASEQTDPQQHAYEFALSGRSGPLGRPLALASFLVNDLYWPTDARSFKYTNVLLHLVTGLLLFWFTWLICRAAAPLPGWLRGFLPWCVTAVWLLHPLNVSTVLYVIQRMTILSTAFTLVGLIAYLKGRLQTDTTTWSRYLWMSSGLAVGLGVGVLCKETAVNLPLYILALEFTLLASWHADRPRPRGWTLWATPMLVIPVLAVIGYQAMHIEGMLRSYETRPFTLIERLLTQPRVLFDYLYGILVPHRAGTGLFHDDFIVSSSLTDPATTLAAIVALVALATAAVIGRRRLPVFSFAVLWFLAGHLFEAGPWPLELYFEHRNYLPMFGPLLAIMMLLLSLPGTLVRLGRVFAILLIAIAGVTTWLNTTLWGNPLLLAETWATERPSSQRAQQFSASLWSRAQQYDRARHRIEVLLENNPRATSAYASRVQIHCMLGADFKDLDFDSVLAGLEGGVRDTAAPLTLRRILRLKHSGKCQGMRLGDIEQMVDALLRNANFQRGESLAQLYFIRANTAILQRDFARAAEALETAISHHPTVDLALQQARLYASAKMYQEALTSIDLATNLDRHRVLGVSLQETEIRGLRDEIMKARDKHE